MMQEHENTQGASVDHLDFGKIKNDDTHVIQVGQALAQ